MLYLFWYRYACNADGKKIYWINEKERKNKRQNSCLSHGSSRGEETNLNTQKLKTRRKSCAMIAQMTTCNLFVGVGLNPLRG